MSILRMFPFPNLGAIEVGTGNGAFALAETGGFLPFPTWE